MSFLIYDLIFLVAFLLFFSIFLYTRRKNLKREGLLYMYRTRWGIRLINSLGNKHKRIWKVLSYVSIATGYLLMIGILYFVYIIIKIYFFNPSIVRAIKVPPIIPLVPYLPQVFRLEFLPPFFFTYWIVILAAIAIPHELAHGIFAAYNKVKIKTTGFAFFPWFLPIFPAAFVEQDEKSMNKSKRFSQMAILSAGTFANVLTAILFFIILVGFFLLAFTPSGVIFDSYATSTIAVAGITSVNGVSLNTSFVSYNRVLELSNDTGFNEIKVGENKFLATQGMLENQEDNEGFILVYNSAPAIKENLSSIITEINGVKIDSLDKLSEEISKYSPGEEVVIKIKLEDGFEEKTLTLEERPGEPGKAWLGVGFFPQERSGIFGKIIDTLSSFKKRNVYYAPEIGELSVFIYNLLWWLVLISISVALINMLPMGIFDGGRFFYLTVLALTKNEKTARKAFVFSTKFFLFILLLLMVFWIFAFLL